MTLRKFIIVSLYIVCMYVCVCVHVPDTKKKEYLVRVLTLPVTVCVCSTVSGIGAPSVCVWKYRSAEVQTLNYWYGTCWLSEVRIWRLYTYVYVMILCAKTPALLPKMWKGVELWVVCHWLCSCMHVLCIHPSIHPSIHSSIYHFHKMWSGSEVWSSWVVKPVLFHFLFSFHCFSCEHGAV